MKFYIDFDNTLFNTPKLTHTMLPLIANEVWKKHQSLCFDNIYSECCSMFNREHCYNIYDLASYFADKYALDLSVLVKNLNSIMFDISDFLYEDSIPFLKKLKADGHKLYLLSYAGENLKYQTVKISGSGISDFFEALYITSAPKYKLDINYSDSIFIDDNPTDLLGLYSNNPLKVIRIRRIDNKYSSEDIDNPNIIEFSSLADFKY